MAWKPTGDDVDLHSYRITRRRRLEDTHRFNWDYPWSKSQAVACRFGERFHPATDGDVQEIGRAARDEPVVRTHDGFLVNATEPPGKLADFVIHCLHDVFAPTALVGIITNVGDPEIWLLEAGPDSAFAPKSQFESALTSFPPNDREAWPVRPPSRPDELGFESNRWR